MQIHIVKRGESLWSISRQYGVPVQAIQAANGLTSPSASETQPGTGGPTAGTPGTTAGTPDYSRQLVVGQALVIPTSEVTPAASIEVNMYLTDFGPRGQQATRQMAPSLTYLAPFSHHVAADGTIGPLNDDSVLSIAKAEGVAPLLVISNWSGDMFSPEVAHTILTNTAIQDKLIANILELMRTKGYRGLNIDFEYVNPSDREAYNSFLRRVVAALRPQGYLISTCLAPKIRADQPGRLYPAHDYPVHGELCDFVVLMTYEWGWIGGPPLAVSPVSEIEKVLNYAITAIPREKILIGVSVYGYDWKLPYRSGTLAKVLTPQGAVDRALREGAEIKYNTTYQAPYYNYTDNQGSEHVVWFEDARSFQAKLDIVKQYRLRGISFWSYPTSFPQVPVVLKHNFRTIRQGRSQGTKK